MGTAIKHPVPDQIKPSFVIFDIRALSPECQSARMSKITNDGLIWSGTGCFIAVPIWQQWASKGYRRHICCCKKNFVCAKHAVCRTKF